MRELRYLGIGLVMGVCLVLAAGQAAAPREAAGPRYSVTPTPPGAEGAGFEFFIVDNASNKIYHRTTNKKEVIRREGMPIEDLIAR